MNEIKLKHLDISCYEYTLKNGLEVILIPFKNKKKYFISYAAKFGSDTIEFKTINDKKNIHVPPGIAHFLEHKTFAQKDGIDPFEFFSKSGTGSNASTSYDNTQYICYGTKKFNENLNYLIKFVNEPYYTDENVNKEMKIIEEEIKMYNDIPDWKIESILRKNIYHKLPRRNDIGGTIKDINKITKEDLYLCYNNFYTPDNMFILIAGNFNKDDALNIIKENMSNIKQNTLKAIPKEYKEKNSVVKKYEEVFCDIKIPKISVGLKVPTVGFKIDNVKLDLYLSIISTIVFGAASTFNEEVENEKLTNSFSTYWEQANKFSTLFITSTTNNPDKLIEKIKQYLFNIEINDEDVSRIKKVWIAEEVKLTDYVEATARSVYYDIINYNKIINNRIDIIKSLNTKELTEIIKNIDFHNISVVKMLPKENKKTNSNI